MSASGFFELEVVTLQNPRGRLANGQCCGGVADNGSPTSESSCQRQCATRFRLCLKEYQRNVTVSSPCTYGNSSSPILAGNSFTFIDPNKANARLVIPFSFRWPVSRSPLISFLLVELFLLLLTRPPFRLFDTRPDELNRKVGQEGKTPVVKFLFIWLGRNCPSF